MFTHSDLETSGIYLRNESTGEIAPVPFHEVIESENKRERALKRRFSPETLHELDTARQAVDPWAALMHEVLYGFTPIGTGDGARVTFRR